MKKIVAVIGDRADRFEAWTESKFPIHERQAAVFYRHEPSIVFNEDADDESLVIEYRYFRHDREEDFRGMTFFAHIVMPGVTVSPEIMAHVRHACERYPVKRRRM